MVYAYSRASVEARKLLRMLVCCWVCAFFRPGVFDGHGPYGHDISNFVQDVLPRLFVQERSSGARQATGQFGM